MKKIVYLLAVCLLVFIACQSESNDYQTDISMRNEPNPDNSELAKLWASGFVNDINSSTRSHRNTMATSVFPLCTNKIYSKLMTRNLDYDALPDTILYVVNLGNDDGFVLVSTDTLLPGVMAYIEHGSLRENEGITSDKLLYFLDGYKDYYIKETKTRDGLVPGPSGDEPAYPGVWRTDEQIPALLSTEWGQGYPYNQFCYTNTGYLAQAGCVAIAAAQICAYHQSPSSYNNHIYDWDAILQSSMVSSSDSAASESVGHLVHDIGVLVPLTYGESFTEGVPYYLIHCWDAFDYHYQANFYCNFDSVCTDLRMSLPVYISGSRDDGNAHAWVIDGMAIRSYYLPMMSMDDSGQTIVEEFKYRSYNLYHCNWGADGALNGYFVAGAFENYYILETDDIYTIPFKGYNNAPFSFTKIYPL